MLCAQEMSERGREILRKLRMGVEVPTRKLERMEELYLSANSGSYSEVELLPPHLRTFPRLAKPADPDDLISTILRIASPTTN